MKIAVRKSDAPLAAGNVKILPRHILLLVRLPLLNVAALGLPLLLLVRLLILRLRTHVLLSSSTILKKPFSVFIQSRPLCRGLDL